MTIPGYLDCKNKKYLECDYFISPSCPNSCKFAIRIKKGISHTATTGLERFLHKFPFYEMKQKVGVPEEEYLGIGAMVVVPGEGLELNFKDKD